MLIVLIIRLGLRILVLRLNYRALATNHSVLTFRFKLIYLQLLTHILVANNRLLVVTIWHKLDPRVHKKFKYFVLVLLLLVLLNIYFLS